MPGVVSHVSNHIEHPELVAQRLERYAGVMGKENVIAGTDCGMGSRVGHAEVCWAKFRAMSQGAAHRLEAPLGQIATSCKRQVACRQKQALGIPRACSFCRHAGRHAE